VNTVNFVIWFGGLRENPESPLGSFRWGWICGRLRSVLKKLVYYP
jgi:hypothetical protein